MRSGRMGFIGEGTGSIRAEASIETLENRVLLSGDVVRKAHDSDNWPLTWADDDKQYTAYGDGRGFEPFIPGSSHGPASAPST